ncbi:hypothetical protein EGR_07507 [Echinococcus granulosus]|uniref:Uncharacterized protein n=1 Tax=Echinococcus granulosus TaxID=6210 RepID=W6UAQ8_ECHGR|nr:hypothetical protein EGR_07507 [Echinococcus granulosus]EUB57631.1 hypothetical protein EGR_07507 [Echinococcus granulosus]
MEEYNNLNNMSDFAGYLNESFQKDCYLFCLGKQCSNSPCLRCFRIRLTMAKVIYNFRKKRGIWLNKSHVFTDEVVSGSSYENLLVANRNTEEKDNRGKRGH